MNWSSIIESTFQAFFGIDAMYFAIAAIGLNVQFGYAGLLNFGQAGFMACGAYGLGMTAHYFHISMWWGIGMGMGYAALLGLLMGVPTLRLRADYLAIVTIAMAEVIRLVTRSVTFKPLFGGTDGINQFSTEFRDLNPVAPSRFYSLSPFELPIWAVLVEAILFSITSLAGAWLLWRKLRPRLGGVPDGAGIAVLAAAMFGVLVWMFTKIKYLGLDLWTLIVGWTVVAVVGLFVWALMRSPWGRVLKGIREDEDAVRAVGKSVYSYKLQALVIGGVIATLGGMMFALKTGSVKADGFSRDLTFYILTALVLGGAAKVSGSIIGPMLFWGLLAFTGSFLNELVADQGGKLEMFGVSIIGTSGQIGQVRFMLVGTLLILLMVYRPQGLFGNRREMALDGR